MYYEPCHWTLAKTEPIHSATGTICGQAGSGRAFTHAPLYYKEIEIFKNQQVAIHKGDYTAQITLPDEVSSQISWWSEHIHNVVMQVLVPSLEHYIESDASNTGWGGIVDSAATARGHWSQDEMSMHINVKELKAALFMLQALCHDKHNTHIKLKLDNTTVVACIYKMASTKPTLMQVTKQILEWALLRNINLSAEHLIGVLNNVADFQSRKLDNVDTEWIIDPVSASLNDFLDFLADIYNSGVGYSVVNMARSAVSSILSINNRPIGQHMLVKRFMGSTPGPLCPNTP